LIDRFIYLFIYLFIKVNSSYPPNGHHWTDIGLLRKHYWEERFYTRLHWLQM